PRRPPGALAVLRGALVLRVLCDCRKNVIWGHARYARRRQPGTATGELQPRDIAGTDRGVDPRGRRVGSGRGHRTRGAPPPLSGTAVGGGVRPEPADPA